MYAYIEGKLTEKNPAALVLDVNGVGYELQVSLYTYGQVQGQQSAKLYTYLYVREDIFTLYGFAEKGERMLFIHLISVSGIGPNTARLVLSSYNPNELREAIISENVSLIKSVKGIGPKTAQRIVLELKDKLAKSTPVEGVTISASIDNTLREEALSALSALGYSRMESDKAVAAALKANPKLNSVEELVKLALKLR